MKQKKKGEREIVRRAVECKGHMLECVSEKMRGDCDIVRAAVQQYGKALQWAAEEMKGVAISLWRRSSRI